MAAEEDVNVTEDELNVTEDEVNVTDDTQDEDMTECEDDEVVTMMDVLQDQEDFEEDANAVLGASDDKNCTYPMGYLKRQAVYACLTCCEDRNDPTKRAGICLACSLYCHENHYLAELYTKRNFRCDCGNPKFKSNVCQLTEPKTHLNEGNIYNQNYSGYYCACERPYPDPEAVVEEEMIQCLICEDWQHSTHLDAEIPAKFAEMICKICMAKNEFLHDYSMYALNDILEFESLVVDGETKSGLYLVKERRSTGKMDKDRMMKVIARYSNADKKKALREAACSSSTSKDKPDVPKTAKADKMDADAPIQKEVNEAAQTDSAKTEKVSDKKVDETKQNDTSSEPEKEKDKTGGEEIKAEEAKHEDGAASEQKDEPNQPKDETAEHKDEIAEAKDEQKDELIAAKPEAEAAQASENPEGKPTETDDTQTKTNEEKTEATSSDKNEHSEATPEKIESSDDVEAKSASEKETANEQVPDTSQPEKKDNSDDKTDAVMDAIDKLLEDHTDTKGNESENKQTNDATENNEKTDSIETKASDIDMSESIKEDKEPLTAEASKAEKSDVDMTETAKPDCSDEKKEEEIKTDDTKENDKDSDTPSKAEQSADDSTEIKAKADETEPQPGRSKSETESQGEGEKLGANEIAYSATTSDNKRKRYKEVAMLSPKKAKLEKDRCVRPKNIKKIYKGATFWDSDFRDRLCKCSACMTMYKNLNLSFLPDYEDTIAAYERRGRERKANASQYEKGMEALSSLGRVQQINALTEYNKLRDKLLAYLKSFKDRKQVVKEADIKAFFAGMKPKRAPDGGVYFCRY
ncbi:uncharacterized protein LOC142975755 [Anticarsia gemmatalis]|uniref:uncharacterized protein LOC142975755 n=1 Tax=Anticarsia gemmatalis TaxID=129554 RepID=UPI003F75815F